MVYLYIIFVFEIVLNLQDIVFYMHQFVHYFIHLALHHIVHYVVRLMFIGLSYFNIVSIRMMYSIWCI